MHSYYTTSVYKKLFITIALLLGYGVGYIAFRSLTPGCLPIVVSLSRRQITITGLLMTLYVPVLSAATILFFKHYTILYVFLFLKGALYCFAGCCVVSAFPNGGWLIYRVAFISEHCGMFALLFCSYFYRAINSRFLPIVVLLLTLIGFYDYFKISPYITVLLRS